MPSTKPACAIERFLYMPGLASISFLACTPNTIHWVFDTYMEARSTGGAMVKAGGDTWFMLYPNYAFGEALQRDTAAFVTKAGGKVLGVMGHSSTNETAIPKERAHLHFEVGLLLSEKFQAWYDAEEDNRGTPNQHGIFNGQNLMGFDPTLLLARSSTNVLTALRSQPVALAVVLPVTDSAPVCVIAAPDCSARLPVAVEAATANAVVSRRFTFAPLKPTVPAKLLEALFSVMSKPVAVTVASLPVVIAPDWVTAPAA